MRSYMGIALAAMLTGLVFAGGCVSKEEYNRVLAMNRNAQTEMDRLNEAVAQLRRDMDALRSERDRLAAENEALNARFASVQQDNAFLADRIKKLQGELDAALAGAGKPTTLPPLPAKVDAALKALAADPRFQDLLVYDSASGMLRFKSELTFEKGKDDVSDAAKAALAKFVEIVNAPEVANYDIYVAGHTDDIPILKPQTKALHPTQWYLSAHRAVAVQEVLEDAGLKGQRISVMGFAEFRPIEPNLPNRGGNPANRRVELWIVPPGRFESARS